MSRQPDFVVVTGLSGAGRSTAAHALEDLGWFVIDNLPPSLVPGVVELVSTQGSGVKKLALVAGTQRYQEDLVPALAQLRENGSRVRVIFLDASTDVLVRRYDDTRRRHPFDEDSDSLIDAIERERIFLDPVRVEADMAIDTGDLTTHDLKARVVDAFAEELSDKLMQTTLMSFGYKYGVPRDADLVFDCRFLANPHWVPELRSSTGLSEGVSSYVFSQDVAQAFVEQILSMFKILFPAYLSEGKAYLTIAFGCTGGKHRSVAMSEFVAKAISEDGREVRTRHRDIDR